MMPKGMSRVLLSESHPPAIRSFEKKAISRAVVYFAVGAGSRRSLRQHEVIE
jgi:hypothetical protein